MDDNIECPFCAIRHPVRHRGLQKDFTCELVGGADVEVHVAAERSSRDDWLDVLAAARRLREDHQVRHVSVDEEHVEGVDPDAVLQRTAILSKPSIDEQAGLALRHLVRRSAHFGQGVKVLPGRDFPVAHAANAEEYFALLELLVERGWAQHRSLDDGHEYHVTAAGHAAHAKAGTVGITVFVSSTVHDLLDCRTELASHLESLGCDVRLSEDPERFDPSTRVDSIRSCLQNVDRSDVVVCLIDQRYGMPLELYKGRSATHVEIEHARESGLPILTFMRDRAYIELATLKRTPDATPNWVEKGNDENRKRWVEFVKSHVSLSNESADRSNWFDQFQTVVDLKRKVRLRLEQLKARCELGPRTVE